MSGRLVRPGAVAGFADALQYYCENAAARPSAGEAGRKAADRYGWDAVNQALVDGYLRIIRQRQAGSRAPRQSPLPYTD